MRRPKILVVAEATRYQHELAAALAQVDADRVEATAATAEERIAREAHDVVIAAEPRAELVPLELLRRIHAADPSLAVLVVGPSLLDRAVEAMRAGADNFLAWPPDPAVLGPLVERALQARRDHRLASAHHELPDADPFLGDSAAIRRLAEDARLAVARRRPILVVGEPGTGKGVLAAWLHRSGPRAREQLVRVRCAALPGDELDRELFGEGARAAPGAAERAEGGTLFLDGVDEATPATQRRLLDLFETGRFRRRGETWDRRVDVRVVASASEGIAARVEAGTFRRDLYDRAGALALRIPPLRERPADVLPLAHAVLAACARESGRRAPGLTRDAEAALVGYAWPGNVRELSNVLDRALLIGAPGAPIDVEDLRLAPAPAAGAAPAAAPAPEPRSLAEVERRHVERVLALAGGRVEEAARVLGLSRSALYDRLRRYRSGAP